MRCCFFVTQTLTDQLGALPDLTPRTDAGSYERSDDGGSIGHVKDTLNRLVLGSRPIDGLYDVSSVGLVYVYVDSRHV